MASLAFVEKKVLEVIRQHKLTIKSTDEQIRLALQNAERMGIFPEWVYKPTDWNSEGEITRWVEDHLWGNGDNEDLKSLTFITKRVLISGFGLDERRWNADDARRYGIEILRQIDEDLKPTDCGRGPRSPYSQNFWKEGKVAQRIGTQLLLHLYKKMHWKSWSEAVEWMYENEGFEELAPWHFVFEKTSRWDTEAQEYTYSYESLPNQECLDFVRDYAFLLNRNETARVLSIIAKTQESISLEKVVWIVSGHKEWNDSSEISFVGTREARVAFILQLLDTVRDWKELEELLLQRELDSSLNSSFLQILVRLFFNYAPQYQSDFLEMAQTVGLVTAVKMYRLLDGIYFITDSMHIKTAVEKLGLDGLAKVLPREDPNNKFKKFVEWYQPQEGIMPQNFSEFVRLTIQVGRSDYWEGFQAMEKLLGTERVVQILMSIDQFTDLGRVLNTFAIVAQLGSDLSQVLNDPETFQIVKDWGTNLQSWQQFVESVKALGFAATRRYLQLHKLSHWSDYYQYEWLKNCAETVGVNGLDLLPTSDTLSEKEAEIVRSFIDSVGKLKPRNEVRQFFSLKELARAAMFDQWEEKHQAGFLSLENILGTDKAWKMVEGFEESYYDSPRKKVLASVQGLSELSPEELQVFLQNSSLVTATSAGVETTKLFVQSLKKIGFEQGVKLFDLLNQSGKDAATVLKAHSAVSDKNLADLFFGWLPVIDSTSSEEDQKQVKATISWLMKAANGYKLQPEDNFANLQEFVKRGVRDGFGQQVADWFGQLVAVLGVEPVWEYYFRIAHTNEHDGFFFVPTMFDKLDAYSIGRIIEQADDIRLLAQSVNAYTPDGTRFDGWRQFVKHTNLQRYSITVPENDPVLKRAVEDMLLAPGINVQAIRNALSTQRFQQLARGEMNSKALLQPVVKRYYLTPTSQLVKLALGESGKAERFAELRQKLVNLSKRFYKAQMKEYQQKKEAKEEVSLPQEQDFSIAVPEILSEDVSLLLIEHGIDSDNFRSIPAAVRFAIGQEPAALNSKQLFNKLNNLAKQAGLKGALDLLSNVLQGIEEEVWKVLEEHKVPMGPCLKAEVLAKSDPRGWTCGDWTVCCMPFGSDKNWNYMYNHSTAYFVVSIDKGNGDERLIAQSVVVATVKTDRQVNAATATQAEVDAWVLDNVEFANNYSQYKKGVAEVYRRFWTTVTPKRVMVGAWHNDLVPVGAVHVQNRSQVRNSWRPLESLSYSDFFGAAECETWLVQEGGD